MAPKLVWGSCSGACGWSETSKIQRRSGLVLAWFEFTKPSQSGGHQMIGVSPDVVEGPCSALTTLTPLLLRDHATLARPASCPMPSHAGRGACQEQPVWALLPL